MGKRRRRAKRRPDSAAAAASSTPGTAAVPRALAPEATPPDPGASGARVLFLPQRTAGVRVNEDTALTCAAVWACVRVISETLAGLPWLVHRRRRDDGLDILREHPVSWLLDVQANPETTAFQFRETLIAHALTWGNGYAEIERDVAGRVAWLWQITPDRVCPDRTSTGQLYYDVANPREPNVAIPAADMLHVRGLGYDGLVGYSVIRMHARSVGLNIAAEESASNFFANDATPGGILTHPGRLKDEARKNLRESWARRHGGPGNRRVLAILEEGMKWEQTSLPPEDAQLLQIMQYGPTEIARIFRVPPHKIADLSRATFSNIEHQAIEFVNDTLRPWAERLESEANVKLFGLKNRGVMETIINLDELKRGDLASQAQFVKEMITWGLFSINDGLAFLNRNPIGPDGDKRFVQQNMQLLENAGEEPPPAPTPAPIPNEQPAPAEGAPPADSNLSIGPALRPVLEDAMRRVFRREEHRAADALKRASGDPAKLSAWLDSTEEDRRASLVETLTPGAHALAGLLGGTSAAAQQALTAFADRHAAEFRDRAKRAQASKGPVHFSLGWLLATDELCDGIDALCGGEGSGRPGPCPSGHRDEHHAGSTGLHRHADERAGGWTARAGELGAKVLGAAKAKAQSYYTKLEGRYGRPLAVGIMAAGLVGVPIPVPGASLLTAAPMIGVAEIYRALRRSRKSGMAEEKPWEEYTDEELMAMGKEWTDALLADWNENDVPGFSEEDKAEGKDSGSAE